MVAKYAEMVIIEYMATCLPERYRRRTTADRQFGNGATTSRVFCGFLTKDTAIDDMFDSQNTQYVLVWLLEGSGWYADKNGQQPLRPGDLVQRLPGHRHSTWSDPDRRWLEFFLAVDAPFHHLLDHAGLATCRLAVLHPGLDLSLLRRCEAFLGRLRVAAPDTIGRLLLDAHALIHDWHTLHDQRTINPHKMAILQACRLLEADLQRPPALRHVAEQVGFSYERFRKIFVEQLGTSPGAWLRARRLDEARARLLEHRGSVAAVADDLGYASAASFVRHFRQQMGVTPGHWRRSPNLSSQHTT